MVHLIKWGLFCFNLTQVPDFLNAQIGGVPVKEVIKDQKWLEEEFTEKVRKVTGFFFIVILCLTFECVLTSAKYKLTTIHLLLSREVEC